MTRRERWVVTIGAALVLGAGLLRMVPLATQAAGERYEQLLLTRRLVAAHRAQIARLPLLERKADSVKQRLVGLAGDFLEGSTRTEAQAALVRTIESRIEHAGATLERSDPVPDSAVVHGVARVQMRASFVGDAPMVWELVRELEAGKPLIGVCQLRIEAAPSTGGSSMEMVKAEVVVEGWYRGEPSPVGAR
jgi:hypothetical protein